MVIILHDNARIAREYLQALLNNGFAAQHHSTVVGAIHSVDQPDTIQSVLLLSTMQLKTFGKAHALLRSYPAWIDVPVVVPACGTLTGLSHADQLIELSGSPHDTVSEISNLLSSRFGHAALA